MPMCGRGTLQKLRRVNGATAVLFSLCALVIYNEFLSYCICTLWWPRLYNERSQEDSVRVLFVADPQIIGINNEDRRIGFITRWDSDRYLSRTFSLAYWVMNPDIVVFMGDLMDEGSISEGAEYLSYYERFLHIFTMQNSTKRLYLAGDNDVGGEGIDPRDDWKVAQFEKHFNGESGVMRLKFIDFIHMNNQLGMTFDKQTRRQVEALRERSRAPVRVLLNHMGFLERYYNQYNKIMSVIEPSVIFTAHTHKSYMIQCDRCRQYSPDPSQYNGRYTGLYDSSVYKLSADQLKTDYWQITVPTCSYRMGVRNMGYGAAVIGVDNSIQYAVYWIPSRYQQLFSYIIVPVAILIVLVLRFLIVACFTYRREFCNISEDELHRKHSDLPSFTGILGYAMRVIHFTLFCWSRLRQKRRKM